MDTHLAVEAMVQMVVEILERLYEILCRGFHGLPRPSQEARRAGHGVLCDPLEGYIAHDG